MTGAPLERSVGAEGLRLLLTAVEPSADALGAALVRALRGRLDAPLALFGVGGPELAAEGLQSLFDPRDLAIVGALEGIMAWPRVRARARWTGELAAKVRPHAAILIDSWGFSLRAAQAIRRHAPETRLIKYVAPQVWATRPGRARTLARRVDALLALHSFDAPYFTREGLWTRVVGNPALVQPVTCADQEALRRALGLVPGQPTLLCLPGSRRSEVARLSPIFGETAARLARRIPGLVTLLAAADAVDQEVRAAAARWPVPPRLITGQTERWAAMGLADVALACSGTVTTELALAGCPMVVGYRLDTPTYLAAKVLLRSPYISLINVAAQKMIAPERLQGECRPALLVEDLQALLGDPAARAEQAAAQTAALEVLCGGISDPAGAAADALIESLGLEASGLSHPRDSSGV